MRLRIWMIVLAALVATTGPLFAQEATIVGTVADQSRAVLPGVTVTATDLATGRQFGAVTAERGDFRMPGMAAGRYKIQAELAGFATVVAEIELLVGQNASVNLTLKVASLSETVSVTSEAPLVDTQSAQVSGNIDRRQMDMLPIQGRNWLELSLMVKGITGNDVSGNRVGGVDRENMFNLSLDGQQISSNIVGYSSLYGQPGLSRDAIAEYQIITNEFDVTQGRSEGMQVQAISKSGSNTLSGSTYGFFRNDSFNAPDFVANKVLPYSDQQTGGTLGGPIITDKVHYFGSYEHERNPATWIVQPPGYSQNLLLPTTTGTDNVLGRLDYQMGAKDHFLVRSTYFRKYNPFDELTTQVRNPSYASTRLTDSNSTTANWSRVVGPNVLQELRVGFFHFHWLYDNAVPAAVTFGPLLNFPGGLSVGAHSNYPEEFWESVPSLREDLTWHKGTHDLKIGGEFQHALDTACWPNNTRGSFTFGSIPADFAQRFPLSAYNDPSQWNLTGLDASVIRFTQNVAQGSGLLTNCGNYSWDFPRPQYAAWVGDKWALTDRVTVNIGARYDLPWSDLNTPNTNATTLILNTGLTPIDASYRPIQRYRKELQPRAGFSWRVSDGGGNRPLVIRGGTGLYFSNNSGLYPLYASLFNDQNVIANSYPNDGRPGFLQNPTRGVTPSQVLSGQVAVPPQAIYVISPTDYRMPYNWQSSAGFQKQVTDVIGIDADLIYWHAGNQDFQTDPNLFYDPTTGYYKNPARAGRPNPSFGNITLFESNGWADYAALSTAVTRRYKNKFQAGLTYTLMFEKNDTAASLGSGFGGSVNNPFSVAENYGRSPDFQRHTVRANTVWNAPWGFGISASFMFGSGNYFQSTSPTDILGDGQSPRLLPSATSPTGFTVIPRDDFAGKSIQKLDLHFSRDFQLVGHAKLSGIAEVFNVLNHPNYGGYNLIIGTAPYGTPIQNSSTTYLPRIWQLGFKVSF